MTREEALKQADDILLELIRVGDPEIMAACRGADGQINLVKLTEAAVQARERIADQIQAGEL